VSDFYDKLAPATTNTFPGVQPEPTTSQRLGEAGPELAPADSTTFLPLPQGSRPMDQAVEWQTFRAESLTKSYTALKDIAEQQYKDDPKKKEEQLQQLQLSIFLGQQLNVEPGDVYKAWDSLGRNPYAEAYFKSNDLPATWWGSMKNEVVTAVHTYRALNIASRMGLGQYDEDTMKRIQAELDQVPAEVHMTDSGGLFNFMKRLPQQTVGVLPYLADMGAAELAVGGVAGLVGSFFGPEVGGPAFAIGRRVGGLLEGTRIGFGQILLDTMTAKDPATGKPAYQIVRDPAELFQWARKMAAVGGALTGAGMMLGVESVAGQLPRMMRAIGVDALAKAGDKGILSTFAGQMLAKYGKNVGTQTTMMDLQTLVNEVFKGAALDEINARQLERGQGEIGIPTIKPAEYLRTALQALPGALESSLIVAAPGSVAEARAGMHEIFARENQQKAAERLANIEHITDPSRPMAERNVDIEARLAELRTAQAALQPKIDALADRKTLDEKAVREHQSNQAEIDWLEWSKAQAEATRPGQPWQMTREEYERQKPPETTGEAGVAPKPGEPPGNAPEGNARTAQGIVTGAVREEDVVNPIDRNLSTIEKVRALAKLSEENRPKLDAALEHVRQAIPGLTVDLAKTNLKEEAKIIEKAARPERLAKMPSHDVEHIRDALRFKVVNSSLEDFGKALDIVLKETGAQVVKLDTEKLFHPGAWGWRFAGADLRMPNGQLVEYYSPFKELDAAKRAGNHALFEKWRNVSPEERSRDPQFRADQLESNRVYQEAFDAGLRRLGMDAAAAEASWNNLSASGFGLSEVPTSTKLSMRSVAEGAPTAQTPSVLTREKLPGEPAGSSVPTSTLPSEGSRETTQPITTPPVQSVAPSRELFKSWGEDISPASAVVSNIRIGLPNLTVEQAQGAALLAKLYAAHVGESLDSWVRSRFVPGIFSTERQTFLEGIHKRGAIDWTAEGKAIFYTTTNSDFVTWVHELTHAFESDLSLEERRRVETWLGVTGVWTRQNHEDFANSALAYIAKGNVPREDLRPVFERYARWVNDVYNSAKVEWSISPDIEKLYQAALSEQRVAPKDPVPEDVSAMFETGPRIAEKDPQDLVPEDLLTYSAFNQAWRRSYFDANGEKIADSRLAPTTTLNLRVGQWMVDDVFKGIHGHEIAQLRELDPASLELPEGDYTTQPNYEGRGNDAKRYAEWMREGKTPPPIDVVETDAGALRVSNGHRRTAAAKMTGQKVLAWIWPGMDHPQGLRVNNGELGMGPVIRVGLTYEGATGRVWEEDQAASQPPVMRPDMLYETAPGEKDPWILKSREIIRERMMTPQAAAEVRKMLEAGGIKEGELFWLGLDDYLKGNKKLRPEEILQYIADHQVEVAERRAAELPPDAMQAARENVRNQWIQKEVEALQRHEPDLQVPSYEVIPIADENGAQTFELRIGGEKYDTYDTVDQANRVGEEMKAQTQSEIGNYLSSQAAEAVDASLETTEGQRAFNAQAQADLRAAGLGAPGYDELVMKTGEGESSVRFSDEAATEGRTLAIQGIDGHDPEQAFRNALRWAAENNYDRVNWPAEGKNAEASDASARKIARAYGGKVETAHLADGLPAVHNLALSQSLKADVAGGQMLFASGPHEESVRQAVEKGMPVPENVLKQYHDREWAQEELDKRTRLQEAARSSDTFEQFYDWQTRSHPEQFPNEAYYRQIWDAARLTERTNELTNQRFTDAMDESTVRYIVGGFTLVSTEADPQAQKKMSTEMAELGKKVVAGDEYAPELLAKVQDQLRTEPDKWRLFFKDYLPSELQQELQTSIDAGNVPEFVPVLPKVANERFTDWLRKGTHMEDFLLTVGSENFRGRSGLVLRLAEQLEGNKEKQLDPLRKAQALREIRKNITSYREAYAVATRDEMMLRQLDAELEKAQATEEGRLLTENQRLRVEIKNAAEALHQTALRETWTLSDLARQKKATAELQARYEKDIAEAKAKLRESVQGVRQTLTNRATVQEVITSTLHKKAMKEIRQRNEAELAILKARIYQAKEAGRQAVQRVKDQQRIQMYAEYINRPVNAGIADNQARMIEDIQRRIAYNPDEVTSSTINRLREWRRQNPDAPMPPDLVQQIEARDPRLITAGEMRQLYDQVKALRSEGRKIRMDQLWEERQYVDRAIGSVQRAIQGSKPPKEIKGLGTVGGRRAVRTPVFKQVMWATWRMNRIAEMMDGGRPGPVTEWLWNRVNDATDEVLRRLETYTKENEKILKDQGLTAREFGRQETVDGIRLTHGQMIGVYVYAQFEDSLFSLREDNHIPDATTANIIKALSPEEKRYGDWMIERLSSDADFDRLQSVQLLVSNTRMDRLPRYFPMQRAGLGGSPMLSDLARELLDMAGKTRTPRARAGFLKARMERTEGVSFPELRLDAPAIYMDHISKREFYIANGVLLKRLNRIFDNREVKATMADRYGTALQPLVQKYIAQYTTPNIYRAFEDYGEFARILRGNVGLSLIGSNLMTILKQLPDIPQIMVMAGPIDGLRAAAKFVANPRQAIHEMWERAPQLRASARSYDRFIEELKLLDRNAYERIMRTVGNAGFAVLKAADTVTNTIGWHAIYAKEMRRTGNDNLATRAAQDFILRKRPAARAKDLAAIYRSPSLGWFLLFTNQQNQQWNILTYDIPHAIGQALHGDPRALISATLDVSGLLIGALAMGLVVRKGAMSAQGGIQDLANVLFGNTPFIGNAIEAAIRGQPQQNALNPFGGAYEAGKVFYDVASGAESAKVMTDLRNVLFTLAGTAGFPVIQAKRIYKTVETGDPWELIGGPPKGGQ
jgi:hypothetical protein